MTQDEARTILGIERGATQAETDAAYKRLMQTVRPDVCQGPETERLARLGTEARSTLSGPPARAAEDESDSTTSTSLINDEEIYDVVADILNEHDEDGLRITKVVSAARERLWARDTTVSRRKALEDRLMEPAFWRAGEARGLWTIGTEGAWTIIEGRRRAGRGQRATGTRQSETGGAKQAEAARRRATADW